MSFVDDANSLKTKLHLREMPASLRIGLLLVGAIILFVLFQGLWQLSSGDLHLIDGSSQSSWQEDAEAGMTIEEGDAQAGATESSAESKSLFVHIVGEVKNPGLYEVSEGARIKEVVDAAGGLTDKANEGSINLARAVNDGEQIVVASKDEQAAWAAGSSAGDVSSGTATAAGGLVNINSADVAGLSSLSGIGEATAKKIIADREKNGPFKSINDLTRVSGIGEKKFEAIKDSITV